MRAALVRPDGVIENVIMWQDGSGYEPPGGLSLVHDPEGLAVIGGTYLDGSFAPPEQPVPDPVPPLRSVAMWRARTIMKVTPWGDGTLFQAVQSAIAGLTDPLQKASAEEALERGDIFDRDGVFVPMLMQLVGVTEEQMDDFMEQAAALQA